MFFESPAQKALVSCSFSDSVRWIHAPNGERLSHYYFRRAFSLPSLPKKAYLLAMAAHYAEIYLNGKAVAPISERSYVFDKSYEVFDVTPYLSVGENLIAVLEVETGENVRNGFALELQADGASLLVSDGTWYTQKDFSLAEGVDFFIGGGEEKVDASKILDDFASLSFDDSSWDCCEVIGNELLHAPYERIHQSTTKAQTALRHSPVAISAVMCAQNTNGYSLRLGPSGAGVMIAMTVLSLNADNEIAFLTHGGIRDIAIDGRLVSQNQTIVLSEGTHFLMIAFSGTADFVIQTDAAISFQTPNGSEGTLVGYLVPIPAVRYPWNEFRGRKPVDNRIEFLLSTSCFEALPQDVRSSVVPLDFGVPSSIIHEMMTRTYLVPQNEIAEERLFSDPRISRGDVTVFLENREALLSGAGVATIPAQDGIVHFILDFGTEQIGRIFFSLDAPQGTVVEIHSFEMIADSGIRYMGGAQTMRYVCREGEQSFLSHRRRGFRYLAVSIYGNDRPVFLKTIDALEIRYPVGTSEFSCSDESLCRIYEMSTRTAQVCMPDLYVDCPGFEQNPWTGDARVTGLVNLCNFGAFDFDANYLRLIARSVEDGLCRFYRTRNPRYVNKLYLPCACFPTYPDGCIPIWSFMWLLQIVDHYDCTGDVGLIADVFYAVRETLARCENMTDERGLFDMQGAWNLIEWANNDLPFYGEVTANNVMLSHCFAKGAEMAELLSESMLAEHYREMSRHYRDAVNRYCWDEQARAYVDTVRDPFSYERYCSYMQEREMETMDYEMYLAEKRISVQTNTMAILFDCVPNERLEEAKRFLIDNLETGLYVSGTPANRTSGQPSEQEAPNGYVHIGSPFFLFFALSAAYKLGLDELALRCQKRDWGSFLESGLTTCIENFKSGAEWTRSAAHAWSASPAIFLIREVLGVKPQKPGYREFSITPKTSSLRFAKGSVPTPFGPIHVEWRKLEDGTTEILCDAPAECRRV